MPTLMIVQVELGRNSREFGNDLQLSNDSRSLRTASATDDLPTAGPLSDTPEQSSPKFHWDLPNAQVSSRQTLSR